MELRKRLALYPLRQGDGFVSEVIHLAWPMVLQQLINSSVILLDNLMVGQLGKMEISAVAVAGKFLTIAQMGMFGLIATSGVYISQFSGAENDERVRESVRFSFVSSLLLAILFVLPAVLLPQSIGAFFTTDPGIREPIAAYMPYAALALLPQIYAMSSQGAMRCLGSTRLPLILGFVPVFTNTILNYLLIFGKLGFPALGVRGAAIATLISRILEMLATAYAVKRSRFVFSGALKKPLSISPELINAIVKRALPLCINEIGFGSGMAVLFKFYGTRGAEVLAAMNISGTVSELFFILFSGMAVATTVIVSKPLGANDMSRARSNAYRMYKLSLLLGLCFAAMMLASSFIFPHFYNVEVDVRGMAAYFIRVYALFYIVYTANAQVYFILRSGGDMKNTLKLDAGFFFLVNVPIVGLATYLTNWSVLLLYLIGQFTDLIKMFLSTNLLLKESWLRNLASEVGQKEE